MNFTWVTVEIPDYALSYLVYGDSSGITEEDKAIIDEWVRDEGYEIISPSDEPAYFVPYPPFGLPCDCVECNLGYRNDHPKCPYCNSYDIVAKLSVDDGVVLGECMNCGATEVNPNSFDPDSMLDIELENMWYSPTRDCFAIIEAGGCGPDCHAYIHGKCEHPNSLLREEDRPEVLAYYV